VKSVLPCGLIEDVEDVEAHSLNALNGFGGISVYDGSENVEHVTPSHKDTSFDLSAILEPEMFWSSYEREICKMKFTTVLFFFLLSPFYSVAKIRAFFVRNGLFAGFRSLFFL
jgi:hypothetical protein